MPIQFRCTRCERLLQTGDDTTGQQAQCPACGQVVAIPGTAISGTAAAAAPAGSGAPPPAPGEAVELPWPEAPAAMPAFQAADLRTFAARRVAGPSIALIVLGFLTIALQLLSVLVNIVQLGMAGAAGRHGDAFPMLIVGPVQIVVSAIAIVGAIVIIVGGMRMKNLENYGLAMTASILTLIPCFGPCCLLGIPIGIWALVALSDNTVRIAFRN
jgi:hypothetical protein